MSFADDMQAMTPTQVQSAVEGRLLRGEGVPWNPGQGEPIWGLLQDAFEVWRKQPELLAAFDAGLHTVMTQSVHEKSWVALEAGAQLQLTLMVTSAWRASELTRWPLQQWLDAAPQSLEHAWALTAVLQLALRLGLVVPLWCSGLIRQQADQVGTTSDDARAEQQTAHLYWLTSLWTALVQYPDFHDALPWLDMWRAHACVKLEQAQEHSLDVVLAVTGERMNKAELHAAISTLRMTRRKEFERTVLALMKDHWPTLQGELKLIEIDQERREQIQMPTAGGKWFEQFRQPATLRNEVEGHHRSQRRSDLCPA